MRIRLLLLAAVLSASPLAGTRAQQGPKVLLLYDMEGVTDATGPQDVGMGSQTYPATRESLTEDVNAAIRGLFKAGAREIVLTDGHGSSNPDPDYLLEKLPQGTRFDIRTAPYDPYIEAMDDSFDAMVAVAMHGKAGGKGFLVASATVPYYGRPAPQADASRVRIGWVLRVGSGADRLIEHHHRRVFHAED